jgi:hypothetical protein
MTASVVSQVTDHLNMVRSEFEDAERQLMQKKVLQTFLEPSPLQDFMILMFIPS